MKKMFILLLLCSVSQIQYGQIIADHTIVDRYDDIPASWIAEVKKMMVWFAGESHAYGYRAGLAELETLNSVYDVFQQWGFPAYTTSSLRVAAWPTGGIGERDWYTWKAYAPESLPASSTTFKNYIKSNYDAGKPISVMGFAWCWDGTAENGPTVNTDPILGVHWWGASDGGPEGNRPWGLDAGDKTVTGNSVSMDTYLAATEDYISYVATNNYPTTIVFTTGPVDSYNGENGYQQYLKYQKIRDYVAAHTNRILFDYADILCYDDNGTPTTTTWNGHIYPIITPTNLGSADIGHIGSAGRLRLAKAQWWLLARIAGWDGGIAAPATSWLGITSDWNVASNWSEGIPSASTSVIISSSVLNQPVIGSLPVAVCKDLTINTGASLTINASRALSVEGNLSNSGTLTVLSGNTDSSGSLIVKGTSTGSVTYNRFLRSEDNFGDRHFFASPVSGQSVSGFTAANSNKISVIDSKYQIWMWNEELLAGNWQLVTSSDNLVSGKGYKVDQRTGSDGMLAFTGSVANSATFAATSPYVYGYTARTTQYDYGYNNPNPIWSGSRRLANYGGGGWNLMGNPFTSAMDAELFINANSLKFDPYYRALYIYDGVNNVYRYVAASAPGFPAEGSSGRYVQAGQGFFVIALYNNIVFNFNSGMQVHNMTVPVLKSAGTEEPWPGLQLRVKYGTRESMTTIVYNNQMTTGLDPGYDVGLMSTGPDVEIYTSMVSENNNVNFTRQALPVIGGANFIIPVGIDSKNGGEVTFSANTVPLENYSFWLEDRTKGLFTDLTYNTYLTTLPANTSGSGRFFIYASINTPSGRELVPQDPPVDIWTLNDRVIIKGYVSDLAFCEVFNLLGEKVMMTNLFNGDLNTLNVSSVTRGIYIVRVVDGQKIINRKLVLN